jgi:hypothetical protein
MALAFGRHLGRGPAGTARVGTAESRADPGALGHPHRFGSVKRAGQEGRAVSMPARKLKGEAGYRGRYEGLSSRSSFIRWAFRIVPALVLWSVGPLKEPAQRD